MAFVFRAKREFKLSDIEENNRFPGEYYQEPQLVKNIEKQSSEFQSKSPRNLIILYLILIYYLLLPYYL